MHSFHSCISPVMVARLRLGGVLDVPTSYASSIADAVANAAAMLAAAAATATDIIVTSTSIDVRQHSSSSRVTARCYSRRHKDVYQPTRTIHYLTGHQNANCRTQPQELQMSLAATLRLLGRIIEEDHCMPTIVMAALDHGVVETKHHGL